MGRNGYEQWEDMAESAANVFIWIQPGRSTTSVEGLWDWALIIKPHVVLIFLGFNFLPLCNKSNSFGWPVQAFI